MHCLSDFIPWNQVSVTGNFVGHIQELIRTEVLPYQWEALNDQIAGAEPSHCLDNFRAAAEKKRPYPVSWTAVSGQRYLQVD